MTEENGHRPPPEIQVLLEPEGKEFSMPRPKTVLQLLGKLGIHRSSALVIRNGGLLTADQRVYPNDAITVRIVTSSG